VYARLLGFCSFLSPNQKYYLANRVRTIRQNDTSPFLSTIDEFSRAKNIVYEMSLKNFMLVPISLNRQPRKWKTLLASAIMVDELHAS
jgi:hypothetical protein